MDLMRKSHWFLLLSGGLSIALAAEPRTWQAAGAQEQVTLAGNNLIRISAPVSVTAGALSSPVPVPERTDAMLITAEVANAELRAATFAVINAGRGETIGYWQNPISIPGKKLISTVLPLSARCREARVFIGTHDRASSAEISRIHIEPLGTTAHIAGAGYGAVIDGQHHVGQTFIAVEKTLAAVVVRVRQLKGSVEGPRLRARIYRWRGSVPRTMEQSPLAQSDVAGELIPGDPVEEEGVIVAYGAAERDLAISLAAHTKPGERYYLDLAVMGPCDEGQGFLTYAWLDSYPDGEMFRNNSSTKWDLCVDIFHAVE